MKPVLILVGAAIAFYATVAIELVLAGIRALTGGF